MPVAATPIDEQTDFGLAPDGYVAGMGRGMGAWRRVLILLKI